MGSNRKNIGERSEPGGSLGHPYPFLWATLTRFFFLSPNAQPGPRLADVMLVEYRDERGSIINDYY